MKYGQLPEIAWAGEVPFFHRDDAGEKDGEVASVRKMYVVRIDNLQDGAWEQDGLWGLSPEMCRQIVDARFIIDGRGRAACAHLWHQGFALWNDPLLRPFDTMIREMLLAPAISAIWSGFYLLADYLYDPATEYYDRERKQAMVRMMAYAWWWEKTGRGCMARHARLDDEHTPEIVELYAEVSSRAEALEPAYTEAIAEST